MSCHTCFLSRSPPFFTLESVSAGRLSISSAPLASIRGKDAISHHVDAAIGRCGDRSSSRKRHHGILRGQRHSDISYVSSDGLRLRSSAESGDRSADGRMEEGRRHVDFDPRDREANSCSNHQTYACWVPTCLGQSATKSSSNNSGSNWHQQRVWQVNRRESSEATPARSLESAAGCIPEQTTEWGGPDIPHTGNLRRRPGDRPSMVGTHPLEAVQSSTAGRSVAITHLPGLGWSEPAGETESIHLEVDYHRQWTHQGGWAGLEPKIRLRYHWRVEQRSLDIHLHRSGRRATSSWVVWLDDSPL